MNSQAIATTHPFTIYFHCGDSSDRNALAQLVKIAPATRSRTGYDFVQVLQSVIKN